MVKKTLGRDVKQFPKVQMKKKEHAFFLVFSASVSKL